MAEKPQVAPAKDITQIVRYLTTTFNIAINSLDRAARTKTGPNQAYLYHTEFAYRLNEVMQGSRSLLQRNITECNEYIDEVMQALNKAELAASKHS